MGCERRVVYDLIDVINGDAKLNQALIKDKRVDALHMLPTSQIATMRSRWTASSAS